MKTISLKELAKYEDHYILLSKDKTTILAADKSLKGLHKKMDAMKDKDTESAIVDYIPPLNAALSLLCE